ncbi:MAG: phosphate ABC transporter ATP-binding protein, partial [Acidobacteria bacterium]|nr:phosphate ABC transporter ATP-binding protein [Acidobacteriota bacterium]
MAEVIRLVDRLDLAPAPTPVLAARGVTVTAQGATLLRAVDVEIPSGGVFGVIGPSGAGKSTLLKVFNRLLELETPPLGVSGEVFFRGRSIYGPGVDPDALRNRIGMLFQQPVVFPTSVAKNVLFGVRHCERLSHRGLAERCEEALVRAALWDEVKDRLQTPAVELSVGQQQRLCLARALALRPEVILMDEPTSALDPRATAAIEDLIGELARAHTIVLVTHDLGQARRIADRVACVCRRDG